MRTLWLEHPGYPQGLMLIFQDEDMLFSGPKLDPVAEAERELGASKP